MLSSYAVIETSQIGDNVQIHEYAVIRKSVIIEQDVIIHPFVVIEDGVRIGKGVEIFPGSYVGKKPKGVGATSRPIKYDRIVDIGDGSSLGPNAVIYYDVIIGENTLVGDGVSIREGSRVGNSCIIGRQVTINYDSIIGDRVKIMDHSWVAGKMTIEDRVFISGGVMTANDNDMGAKGYRESEIAGPWIKRGARIGAGAILLPGVIVGINSVVAAGSVVSRDVPDFTVVMGVPARYVKMVNLNDISE